ncbi:MAG: hypothetical protein KH092_05775, partial [Actinomyces sp.]|nr:hypothetical protein [Actinomyces sp.]
MSPSEAHSADRAGHSEHNKDDRDKSRPAQGFQRHFREKVRPARLVQRHFREKVRQARLKTAFFGH